MSRRVFILLGGVFLLMAVGGLLWLAVKDTTTSSPESAVEQEAVSPPKKAQRPPAQEIVEAPEAPLPQPELDPTGALKKDAPKWQSPPAPILPPDVPATEDDAKATRAPEAPAGIASPAEAMRDAARFLLSRYEYLGKRGRLNLELYDLVERYAPKDLPPNMVYAVSPTAMRLVFMFTEQRFVELLRQEAQAQLPVDAAADFLQRTAEWLHGAASCVQALELDRPRLAAPLDGDDCRRSLARIRSMLDQGNRIELESTAERLLKQLAADVEGESIVLRGGADTAGN